MILNDVERITGFDVVGGSAVRKEVIRGKGNQDDEGQVKGEGRK